MCGFPIGSALGQTRSTTRPTTHPTTPPSSGEKKAGDRVIDVTGDRLSGFVLPTEPIKGDIVLSALRAQTWTVDDTKRLVLEGDVRIHMGGYNFSAPSAVVWLNRIPSGDGLINQVAIYFEQASDPSKQAGLGVGGQDLLVTGSSRGEVNLHVTALTQEKSPPHSDMIQKGQMRLANYLRSLVKNPPPLENRPQVDQPVSPDTSFKPVPGGRVSEKDAQPPTRLELPPRQEALPWLAQPQGMIRFSAAKTEIQSGVEENLFTLTGPISVEMETATHAGGITQLSLTAERGVIFTEPSGPKGLASGELSAQSVRGIYLEGNVSAVVNNGWYTVRAPQMYYDFRGDRAIMVNSLLRTYPRGGKLPVNARAEEMRQLAANQWDASKVNVSTSEFFTPHISIGAESATITQRPSPDDPAVTDTFVQSHDNAMEVEGIPVAPFPDFSGKIENPPLRELEVTGRKSEGIGIRTSWDLFTLIGAKAPDRVEADLKLDGFSERGPGVGSLFKYDLGDSYGRVDLYGLYDTGTDRTSSGGNVEPDKTFRGVALDENTLKLNQYWTLQTQLSYISDRTFITSWRENDFNERREYETSIYLKNQRENAAFMFLARYELNDFLSNSYPLADKQYAVDKVPELTYRRYGDSLLGDSLTYSTENRLTRMKFVFQNSTPAQIGVPGAAFGIFDDQPIDDLLRARGLKTNYVDRFDSRHELALPLHEGALNIEPFIVGRLTGYDDGFDEFSSDSDSLRFFGAAGVRFNMQFQRIYNDVENQVLDLHRLRHIIEPYVTLWHAYSSVNQDDLPIYDTAVESLASGTAVEIGLRNTLQTQRGGPGQWRSVDVLSVDNSLVLTDEDGHRESPTPQFFDYRPEYSQFGDQFHSLATWLLSDSVSLVGEETYDLDNDLLARGSVGVEIRHSPVLVTYIEYRYIDVDKNELLAVGWTYQITPKYSVTFTPQYDFEAQNFRSVALRVTRTFPDFTFAVQVRHDQIRNDTSFGAQLGLVQF